MVENSVFWAIFGASVGSFVTLWVERFESELPIINGRSQCDSCRRTLRFWELIPVLSFFFQKGKCARCQAKLLPHYPIFELLGAAAFVVVGQKVVMTSSPVVIIFQLLFLVLLLFLMFYDWLTLTFPTPILLIAVAGSLGLAILSHWLGLDSNLVDIGDPLFRWLNTPTNFLIGLSLGGLVGSGLLALLAIPSGGRWMGYGDILIGLMLGFWLGYPAILVSIVLAFYIGAVIGLIQIVAKRVPSDHRLAFGPCLIVAGIVTYGYGDKMIVWIMNILGVVA